MISCKRASELISKSADEKLGRIEAVQLTLHLLICKFCLRFRRNVEILRAAVRIRQEETADEAPPEDPNTAAFKERLKESVQKWIEKK
jgi:hypothetical protein